MRRRDPPRSTSTTRQAPRWAALRANSKWFPSSQHQDKTRHLPHTTIPLHYRLFILYPSSLSLSSYSLGSPPNPILTPPPSFGGCAFSRSRHTANIVCRDAGKRRRNPRSKKASNRSLALARLITAKNVSPPGLDLASLPATPSLAPPAVSAGPDPRCPRARRSLRLPDPDDAAETRLYSS